MNAPTQSPGESPGSSPRRLLLALIPLACFLALAALFLTRLGVDSSRVPSALVGRPAPAVALPPLEGSSLPGFSDVDLKSGGVTLVNVFASWCAPCRDEHPVLMKLAADANLRARGVRIAGLAYKDEPANALRFLGELGTPYAMIGMDRVGRSAIEWGVYGVPETFVVRGDGTIAYKFVGPLSETSVRTTLLPEIEKAMR